MNFFGWLLNEVLNPDISWTKKHDWLRFLLSPPCKESLKYSETCVNSMDLGGIAVKQRRIHRWHRWQSELWQIKCATVLWWFTFKSGFHWHVATKCCRDSDEDGPPQYAGVPQPSSRQWMNAAWAAGWRPWSYGLSWWWPWPLHKPHPTQLVLSSQIPWRSVTSIMFAAWQWVSHVWTELS